MNKSDIVGVWSFNAAYQKDLSADKQIHYREDGSGSIVGGSEVVLNFEWDISIEGDDLLMGKNSMPTGELRGIQELRPVGATLKQEELPMGKFKTITFEHFSLPFGLRKFAKI